MIDAGGSMLVMPRSVANLLGVKYKPMDKGVIQLDDTFWKIIGVSIYLNISLHTCFSCIVFQDISILDLPKHSVISLSSDF